MTHGRVQAEDYDTGGQGIAYFDQTIENQGDSLYRDESVDIKMLDDGHVIGFMQTDEWLEYTISVAEEGDYIFGFKVLSQVATARIHLEINGVDVTGEMVVPQTGEWNTDSWATIYTSRVKLIEGENVLRIVVDAQWFDLDLIDIHGPFPLFADGFESGDVLRWSR